MKQSKLSYENWKCILSKQMYIKQIDVDWLKGHIVLIEINEVSEPQKWYFNNENIIVCDKGMKWLSILPQNDYYCITAMMNEKEKILLWYIDMIANQGIDAKRVPYFDDLYLDLVVCPDGTIVVDDMEELELALQKNDITQEQYDLAMETSSKLQKEIQSDIYKFRNFTKQCYEVVRECN